MPPDGETASAQLSLDQLLLSFEVVSLHVPLAEDTWHLIDRRTRGC